MSSTTILPLGYETHKNPRPTEVNTRICDGCTLPRSLSSDAIIFQVNLSEKKFPPPLNYADLSMFAYPAKHFMSPLRFAQDDGIRRKKREEREVSLMVSDQKL